jgi:hypothetical protein
LKVDVVSSDSDLRTIIVSCSYQKCRTHALFSPFPSQYTVQFTSK